MLRGIFQFKVQFMQPAGCFGKIYCSSSDRDNTKNSLFIKAIYGHVQLNEENGCCEEEAVVSGKVKTKTCVAD